MTEDDIDLDLDLDQPAPPPKPAAPDWSPQQAVALRRVDTWLDSVHAGTAASLVFRLFGYAGTGKSTLAKHVGALEAARPRGFTQFASFTGKAAVVMRRKGCENARTLHSCIYTSHDKSTSDLDRLNGALKAAMLAGKNGQELHDIQLAIKDETENLAQPGFSKKPGALHIWAEDEHGDLRPRHTISLWVIDECSMVDSRLGTDLLSFGAPVLVLGDPAQLPPVAGQGFFTEAKPDVLLTEIHRQALGSPIIDMANQIRQGNTLNFGGYGDSCAVVPWGELKPDQWIEADQILVGRNATRRAVNNRIRVLTGKDDFLPMPGEKLVCLRNNHDRGLLNGSLWECIESEDVPSMHHFKLKACSIDGDDRREVQTIVHKANFMGDTVAYEDRLEADEFDFGYALTVHKAQGSQWDNVILMDEWFMRDTRQKWLYTGVTRAAKRITVVRK